MRLSLTLTALAFALPMPLLAQSADPQPVPSPSPSPSPKAKKDDPNRLVCRREVKTSSRMGAEKTCLTREQWAQRDEAGRRALRETEGNR